MKFRLLILYVLLFFIGSSCIREDDDEPPIITILSPNENKNYQIDESINIEATVSDNKKIERVIFRIRSNETNNIVLPQKSFTPDSKEESFKVAMEITDTLLNAGLYYIEIEADDGVNETSFFRFIRIEALVRKKLALIVATSNGTNTTVYGDKNDNNFQPLISFPYSFGESLVNNDDQHFWFLPKNNNQLFVYSLRNNSQLYTEQYNSNFSETFIDLGRRDRIVYVSRKEEIDAFSERFTDKFTFSPLQGRKLYSVSTGENYLMAAESDLLGGDGRLHILGYSSGVSNTSISFPFEIVKMFSYNSESIIIFYNTPLGGAVADFRITDNAYRSVLDMGDSLQQVVQITSNEYLVSDNSKIMRYRVNTESAIIYRMENNAVMHYDEFTSSLYVGSQKTLKHFNYPQSIGTNLTSFNEDIKSITVRYNRN